MPSSLLWDNKQGQVTCSFCILMHDVFPVFSDLKLNILFHFCSEAEL